MNTFLSSAQEAQLEQYRAFAKNEVAPIAALLASHQVCLKEFLQKLGQQGYLGITAAKQYGGQGGTLLDLALFVEAVSAYDPGLGLTIGDHAAVIAILNKYGSEQQKSSYLPLLARGEAFATLAFSEPAAGTDFEAVQTTCCQGDGGHLAISGNKSWVVTGDFANLFLVLARQADGQLAMALVDRESDGSTFKLVKERRLMGLRSAYINDIEFANAQIRSEQLIGESSEPGQFGGANPAATAAAVAMALYAMDVAKVMLSAAAIGMLHSSTDLALEHARHRQQFGTNIGQFQAVQWKLADMGVEGAGARMLTYRAAWSHEGDPEQFRAYAAMAKAFSARAARAHSGEALQILGASGLEENEPLARFYDDAKTMEIAQGTSEWQKMLLVKELNI